MNTFERVRTRVAQQLDIDAAQITSEASLKDDLAADSLDVVEIIMALEEEFDVEFDEAASNLTTMEQITDYIENKTGVHA